MSKKPRRYRKKYGEPDGNLVIKATSGDYESILLILDFYRGYINSLAKIRIKNEKGDEEFYFDDELCDELIQKLIEATLKFNINR